MKANKIKDRSLGEFFSIILIGLAQVAAVLVCISFVAGAFEISQSCAAQHFEDDGLLLAQITGLILTTPWNIEKTLTPTFVFIISATLFFTFATSIIISENSIENLRPCSDTNGKKGAYYSLVWINLFSFLHTAVLWGYRIYTLS